jgi:hypothetical protein
MSEHLYCGTEFAKVFWNKEDKEGFDVPLSLE